MIFEALTGFYTLNRAKETANEQNIASENKSYLELNWPLDAINIEKFVNSRGWISSDARLVLQELYLLDQY